MKATTTSGQPVTPTRLLSIPTVAAALDVDRRTLYRLIEGGAMPVVDLRTGPRRSRLRIPAAAFEEFVAGRTVTLPPARRRPRSATPRC
ncbi:helix-turn-helix domain-containing protein [Streptomyces hiroshimensis]|uniref:Helix-turn-helix domain-containing protein n=1 Tax=Streptomyces hiroshimensis TaxID=66424 RepID=A0ABQ2Y324_9ACTN|nr:helix-turn-helix domain-containing protein [Streptomyces hiroshimensis]GGX60610.1 hypothetical protein GCM10010324_01520 [Streptomyces hiroshimensis]